ncbi:SDR family NAD(P)-dependent oxidoreductase [Actinotalea sp. Marseille-Q4924]|uniref:SDR family NAD(P)-dependent oxidoreductase n=1 Tax=Actinotalea sp. Marseille-Q4924 TaxID=2866571 RepID=UPI001CE4B365|nr:SDR family oxidoreductase [Actinotalea sp. Marseille-Q4924]
MTAPRISAPRTAVVTGAGRGIGRGLALGLAEHGYAVALLGRTAEHLEAVAEAIATAAADAGRDAPPTVVVPVELTDAGSVAGAVERVEEAFADLGGVGLLVNNAGVIERVEAPLLDTDVEETWRVVETNVRGPLLLTQALLGGMLQRGGGRIVNINSGAAYGLSRSYTGYGISKGALARLTTLVDTQYRDQGIRAFDLAPGVVRTDMTTSMPLHDDREHWTPVEASVELLVAVGDGDLDPLSGRFLRAGSDTPHSLEQHAYDILVTDSRRLSVTPYGHDDPIVR